MNLFERARERRQEGRRKRREIARLVAEHLAQALTLDNETAKRLAEEHIGKPGFFQATRRIHDPDTEVPETACPLFEDYTQVCWPERGLCIGVDFLSVRYRDDPAYQIIGDDFDVCTILCDRQGAIYEVSGMENCPPNESKEQWPTIYHFLMQLVYDSMIDIEL